MPATFINMSHWTLDEEVVDIEENGETIHLYHEWDLVGVFLRPDSAVVTFARSQGSVGGVVDIVFGGLLNVELSTYEDSSTCSPSTFDKSSFRHAFNNFHYMVLEEEADKYSRFSVHFSDKVLTVLAESVLSRRGLSLLS